MIRTDDGGRAVSDLLGFAVVFGIVVLSISLVYTFGLGALTEVQDDEAFDNAERAFDIIADNMADIHRNGAPGRSTEVDFQGGDLALAGQTTLEVNTSKDGNVSVIATPIRYRSGDRALFYAAGAVVRTDRDTARIVNEPPFRFDENRTVISAIETIPDSDTDSISGGTARVRSRGDVSTVPIADTTGDVTFNISVTSPRFRAWKRYFEREGLNCPDVDTANNTVVCRFTTDELYVRETKIKVGLSA